MRFQNTPLFGDLNETAGSYLQVLLTDFTLVHTDGGTRMEVCIRHDSPVIRHGAAKATIKSMIADFATAAEAYQRQLEAFLIGRSAAPSLAFSDANFAWRYASGGVLPILEMDGEGFYCLFYRDIDPVGWNIANGGTDTREELLNPEMTIEREFCEELLVIDERNSNLLRFACDRVDSLSKSRAREYWKSTAEGRCESTLSNRQIPVEWINGPDSVSVTVEGEHNETSGYFLNINALDFGIEVDRVARISLHDKIIACDGELLGPRHLNRPIGLFSMRRLNERIVGNVRRFEPDIIFHDGVRMDGVDLDEVVYRRFLPKQVDVRTSREGEYHRVATKQGIQYDLCPVTRSIIRRFIAQGDSSELGA